MSRKLMLLILLIGLLLFFLLLFLNSSKKAMPIPTDCFSFENSLINDCGGTLKISLIDGARIVKGGHLSRHSVSFTGFLQALNFSYIDNQFSQPGTVMMWFKQNDLEKQSRLLSGNVAEGITLGDGGCGYRPEMSRLTHLVNCYFYSFDEVQVTSGGDERYPINDSEWHHFALSWGEYLTLYLDGRLVGKEFFNSSFIGGNSGKYLGVGDLSQFAAEQNNFVDDIKIFNYVLNQSEIIESSGI